MHDELVEKKRWIINRSFLHALSHCMILPGPEAQQLTIYIGWKLDGKRGGIVAGTLFVLPSMFIPLALSVVYVRFGSLPWISSWPGLLRIPFGQFRRNRGQITEQASGAVVWSGGEVYLCGRCSCGIVISRADVPRAECPDPINGERLAACILEKSGEFSGSQVIGGRESTRLRYPATFGLAA